VGNRSSYGTNTAQPLVTQPASNQIGIGNRLLQSGASSFSYDANGSLLSSTNSNGTTNFSWDGRNRLTLVSGPSTQASFQYDFEGNLISQSINGDSRTYLLDDLTNVAVLNDDGDQEQVLSGQSIDQHFALTHSSGKVEYGLTDAINSTTIAVDQTGTVRARLIFEPFGQLTLIGEAYPFQFTGRTAAIGGLYYYRARDYEPTSGRFVSEDPLGFLDVGLNLYRYASNNPVRYGDPTGMVPPFGGLPNGAVVPLKQASSMGLGMPGFNFRKLIACLVCEAGLEHIGIELILEGLGVEISGLGVIGVGIEATKCIIEAREPLTTRPPPFQPTGTWPRPGSRPGSRP
jgi:RHS repeat-associated protein